MKGSKFSIGGHPLHPALVVVPIGLLVWSVFSMAVYVIGDVSRTWYDMAYFTAIGGVLTALAAALPGFGDYFTMALQTPSVRGIATAHMLLNLAAVALFAVAAALMFDDGALDGSRMTGVLVLMIVGVGTLALSGYLGGEMVFKHKMAVVEEAEPAATGLRPVPPSSPPSQQQR
jgi:uncharacterized membrane protein